MRTKRCRDRVKRIRNVADMHFEMSRQGVVQKKVLQEALLWVDEDFTAVCAVVLPFLVARTWFPHICWHFYKSVRN